MDNPNTTWNATDGELLHVTTFYVGNYFFGIDVFRVQEVLRMQSVTKVPLAPAVIEGLLNLRGQILPVLNMRLKLQLASRLDSAVPMNIIIRTDEGAVSLVVDDIGDVLDLEPQYVERPPTNIAPGVNGLIRAVYKLENSLLLLLDIDRAIEVGSGSY